MDLRTALISFLQRHDKDNFTLLAGAICGLATYIFCFHPVIFAILAITASCDHFLTKPRRSLADTCIVSYCCTVILMGIYTVFEKVRTGDRPVWLIQFEEEIVPFSVGSVLLISSFKICEWCGNWGDLFDNLKLSVNCWVIGMCFQITSTKVAWAVGLQAAGLFVACGSMFDAAYQEGCKNGTEMWPGDFVPALLGGRLFKEMRKLNEEKSRQKETQDEQGKPQMKHKTSHAPTESVPAEQV